MTAISGAGSVPGQSFSLAVAAKAAQHQARTTPSGTELSSASNPSANSIIDVGDLPDGIIDVGDLPDGIIDVGDLPDGIIDVGDLPDGIIDVGDLPDGVQAGGFDRLV